MPSKCVVPGCQSFYNNKKTPKCVSSHAFPKDEKLKQEWIRAIPREDQTPSNTSRVCSLHFDSVQFVEESVDSTRDIRTKLKRKRLISTAVPSKFPNLPHYYSKSISVPRSSASSTASRFQKEENIQNQKNELFLKSDVVTCLSDLI